MNINTSELFVLAIPFMGTTLGAAMVFLLKDNIAPKLEKLLLGFASGVMIAASVWSLLIPSIDMQKARNGVASVSYTHLDVYKRQRRDREVKQITKMASQFGL